MKSIFAVIATHYQNMDGAMAVRSEFQLGFFETEEEANSFLNKYLKVKPSCIRAEDICIQEIELGRLFDLDDHAFEKGMTGNFKVSRFDEKIRQL